MPFFVYFIKGVALFTYEDAGGWKRCLFRLVTLNACSINVNTAVFFSINKQDLPGSHTSLSGVLIVTQGIQNACYKAP